VTDGGELENLFGLYPALITNLVDPSGLARIEVRLPWLDDPDVRVWATLLSPCIDGGGAPLELGTEVVVGFEAGNPRRPYVLGTPRGQVAPTRVTLSTRQGHAVTLDDREHTVEVRHADGATVTLTADGRILVQATSVEVTAATVHVQAATAEFDGAVSCATLIASTAVVSPVFTPAGP
jgi:Type VI secretion system/phage-baseplate injector OB domain